MESFKVAAVQMNCMKGDLDGALSVHEHFSRDAAEAGARLVLFPELGVTGHYGDAQVTEFAEEARKGRIFDAMSGLARELDIVISYGLCEKAAGTFYNSQVLVGPEGLVGVQRKVHASKDEYFHFRMGREYCVFDLGFCRVGTLICYDSAFFEAWRTLALMGADLLLLPHASRIGWGVQTPAAENERRLEEDLDGLPGKKGAYADDNSVYVVYANQAGYNGHSSHLGGAFVIAPDQSVPARSEATLKDQMITAELDPELLEAKRRKNSIMRNRRPEVYGELTRMI